MILPFASAGVFTRVVLHVGHAGNTGDVVLTLAGLVVSGVSLAAAAIALWFNVRTALRGVRRAAASTTARSGFR